MRNKEDTSIGKHIYLYFEGDFADELRPKRRPKKNGVIVMATVLEANNKKRKPKIIAVSKKRYFADKSIYGGHGIKLDATDVRIITQAEFDDIPSYDKIVLEKICKDNGFSAKKFIAAYKKFVKNNKPTKAKKTKSDDEATNE